MSLYAISMMVSIEMNLSLRFSMWCLFVCFVKWQRPSLHSLLGTTSQNNLKQKEISFFFVFRRRFYWSCCHGLFEILRWPGFKNYFAGPLAVVE